MAVNWTEEQQKVINTRDCNILVSAAAGSGKTAVLVARILAIITDETHPVDIDRLLVVTFTNAAAAEMRERIRDALELRAEEEPDNTHLQRQLVLVHNAKITTIHSFCLHVLRNHFQTAGIDPGFRIADEGEVLLLEQEAVKETVDEAYEAALMNKFTGITDPECEAVQRTHEEFLEFLEQYIPGKNDHAIEEMILDLYHFSLGQPWPYEWLEQCKEMYEKDWDAPENAVWTRFITEDTERILTDAEHQIQEALCICEDPDGPYPYIKALQSDLDAIEQLKNACSYQEYAQNLDAMPGWARLAAKKDDSISAQKKELVQQMRTEIKNIIAGLRKQYYFDRPEVLFDESQKSGVPVRALVRLTENFMKCLAEKKQEKNVLDFSDMEHFALKVLVEKKDGKVIPSAAAREYAETFEELMIDEYQDSNLVQELILTSVSGKGTGANNLFMVGDVKQSIYRFRLARPELFMEKYRTYQKEGTEACRIDLHKNFRSREEVLTGVNDIFRQIMTESLGGITYDADAALYPGAVFAPLPQSAGGNLSIDVLLLEADSSEKQEAEARLVGQKIRQLVENQPVWDKELERYRPACYSDIVILLRTVSGWADTFGEVLQEMGIPCFTGSAKGYFSATEIRIMLAYLQILDNPLQDLPFAAVLHSAIGRFSEEDLAKIHNYAISAEEDGRFYKQCIVYRESGPDHFLKEKLEQFFRTYEELRAKCPHTPVHLLIWEILDVTGFGAYVQALPGGNQRKANLDMLVEKAISYEATSFRGLYHFVRYIENLKKYEVDYGEANTGSEAENTVRIMSIHKSKGLEFPIVFVSGMGKQFNESDSRSKVVLHPEYGIAGDFVDSELRVRQATLLKKTIQRKIVSENLGEELRVLYVAMTRAKEKLVLTGSVTDAEKKQQSWENAAGYSGETLSYSVLSGAAVYLDWVMPALMRDISADFQIQWLTVEDSGLEEQLEEQAEAIRLQELLSVNPQIIRDEETREYLNEVFAQNYPYDDDNDIIGKISVSELKKLSHMPEETDARELYEPEIVVPLIPLFRQEGQEIVGAARGTIYHSFMENLDYSRKDQLELQLEEMISCGKMTREESAALNLEDMHRFLETESGKRMERAAVAGLLYREKPFVFGVPANEIRSTWNSQETVLVQGIIDAWFQEGEELVVLDYKTDRVSGPKVLIDKYQAQLDYYAGALERLTGRKVKDKIIYSFHLGRDIVL